jgi:hypothetical protein
MSKRDSSKAGSGSADYEIGYGRPPVEHQFKPGKSGNRNGRPRKDKEHQNIADQWGTSTLAAGKVLYEEVTVTQNGKSRKMPMIEAVHRRRAADALKGGNRLLQREVIAEANAHERRVLELEVQYYCEMRDKKAEGEQLIAKARARGLPEPELLPHPDDIILDHEEKTAWVDGPATQDALILQKFVRDLRDHVVLRAAYVERFPSYLYPADPGASASFKAFATALDQQLCARMQWHQSGFWNAKQSLMRYGFRFMEAFMTDSLEKLQAAWQSEPALAPLRRDKRLLKTLSEFLAFKTRTRERIIWQRQHNLLLAVYREAFGAEKVAHLPKRASMKPYAERLAQLEALPADDRERTRRQSEALIEAGIAKLLK